MKIFVNKYKIVKYDIIMIIIIIINIIKIYINIAINILIV